MSSSHEDPTGLIIRVTFQHFSTSFGVPGPKKALIWPNMTLSASVDLGGLFAMEIEFNS